MKQLYYHNNKAYLIHRKIPYHFFPQKGGKVEMDALKDVVNYFSQVRHQGVDHILKTNTHFLFVETIQEAEIVE